MTITLAGCDEDTLNGIQGDISTGGHDGKDGKDGVDGKDGKDGTSCTVIDTTGLSNRTGYKLICADTLKGIVWDGLDGAVKMAKTVSMVRTAPTEKTDLPAL